MGALELDLMTWQEVKGAQDAGHDTVVVAFGATEQHGPHLPLATDALIGDHLSLLIADRLDAFRAPTVRVGCSEHHLAFPGTLSVSVDTFAGIVGDILHSLARGGFRRAVLIPTHGGNFIPLGTALEDIGPIEGLEVRALTDLSALLTIARVGQDEHGVPMGEGGLHGGEWETSMLLAIHPDLVHDDRREAGFTGDPAEAVGAIFEDGVHTIAPNGVIGDPDQATAAHGARYWAEVIEIAMREVES
jgi:creatinine amidohydrolase